MSSTAHAPVMPEFEFAPADFARVRRLIHERAGIDLHPRKQAMVYSRLARRLRETGHPSCAAYLRWLEVESGPAAPEWQQFVNCLTTNLTSFFREAHHFEMLAEALKARAGQPVSIWCNAASSGEEAHSIAMTAIEASRTDLEILASDVDTHVLAVAEQGVYSAGARGLSAERRRRHCMKGKGAMRGNLRIKPEVARLIRFRRINLMHVDWGFVDPFDIVFCRNVMIYFDAATQAALLARMHAAMKPHGLLFLGHADHAAGARELFRLHAKTVYERL